MGVLGVIGPTRMAYERVIPIVDMTAKLLGARLEFPPISPKLRRRFPGTFFQLTCGRLAPKQAPESKPFV